MSRRVFSFDMWLCLAIAYGISLLPNLFLENYSELVQMIVLSIVLIFLRHIGSRLGLFYSIFNFSKDNNQGSLAKKLLKKFSYDYCNECKKDMDETVSKLYFVPLNASAEIPMDMKFDYFEQKAVPINDITEIPTNFHGAYAKIYRCGSCGKTNGAFEVFLPVRDQTIEIRNFQVEGNRLRNLEGF